MKAEIVCPQCGENALLEVSAIERARRAGLRIFCGRKCAGLARRKYIPLEVKKQRKREYDMEYREKNLDKLRGQKAEYYQRTRDPEKEKIIRQARMKEHVEYCRQPKYRAYKRDYDLKYRAEKLYGQFAEASLILRDIEVEINNRMTWVERHQANGTLNKSTQRKRQYAIQTGTPYPR